MSLCVIDCETRAHRIKFSDAGFLAAADVVKDSFIAPEIDGARLWRRHLAMAEIGATPKGGVNRLALTAEDARARALLLDWAEDEGLRCAIDMAGNMFFRYGEDAREPAPVLTGSHIDTEPTGGRFDGVFGVLAGFEAIGAIARGNPGLARLIDLVVWTNEEGCRFEPGCMGSSAYCHPSSLPAILATTDEEGVCFADALSSLLKELPQLPSRDMGRAPKAYVEAHIEQGPLLERLGATIGVVTGIQGSRRYSVIVKGEAAHAGTVPNSMRKDALFCAIDLIKKLQILFYDSTDTVRFTIGRLNVVPNSPSVVPGEVSFTIDFRHPDRAVLEDIGSQVARVCQENRGVCEVAVKEIISVAPVEFPLAMLELISGAAERLGLRWERLPSGAGHDARNVAQIATTGMIFVPCHLGISHNEAESATPSDLTAGTQVLAEVLVSLAETVGIPSR